jgi:hypothetical protein
VEKDASADRAAFLKELLEYNGFTVVVVPSPPPKVAPKPVVKTGDGSIEPTPPSPATETFIIGVTDYTFNPVNAIFGRLLKTPDGHVVTLAYWEQKDKVSRDDIPYFDQ